jgi:hypothetical protein
VGAAERERSREGGSWRESMLEGEGVIKDEGEKERGRKG